MRRDDLIIRQVQEWLEWNQVTVQECHRLWVTVLLWFINLLIMIPVCINTPHQVRRLLITNILHTTSIISHLLQDKTKLVASLVVDTTAIIIPAIILHIMIKDQACKDFT